MVLVVYFYEFIIYMLLEKNAFDSIAFFSQCKYIEFANSLDILHVQIESICVIMIKMVF